MPRPLPSLEQVVLAQEFDVLPDRDTCDGEFPFELLESRNFFAFDPLSGIHALPHDRRYVDIKRRAAAIEELAEFAHADCGVRIPHSDTLLAAIARSMSMNCSPSI